MQKITTPQRSLMHRLFLALFALLVAGLSWADPIEDALAAYDRKDYATMLSIVKPQANKGEAWAQALLANAYRKGQGVVQDYAEAVKWFKLAAQQGDMFALNALADMYDTGQGVVQDYAEAVKWYRLVAQQGNSGAQVRLGFRYFKGEGVVQDYVKAHSWFNLGAVNGSSHAVTVRDSVAKLMTPQQIADAQKLARDCQARQLKGCD